MVVRIEVGAIEDCGNGEEFRRFLSVVDGNQTGAVVARVIYAKTREELEIIGCERD